LRHGAAAASVTFQLLDLDFIEIQAIGFDQASSGKDNIKRAIEAPTWH